MSIETCVCTPTSETLDFEELVRQLADHNDITPTDDMLEPGAYHARIDDLFISVYKQPSGYNLKVIDLKTLGYTLGNEEQQKEYATRNKALKGIGLHQKKSTLSISDYQYHSNDLSQQQLDTLLTLFPTQTPLQYDAFEGTYQT